MLTFLDEYTRYTADSVRSGGAGKHQEFETDYHAVRHFIETILPRFVQLADKSQLPSRLAERTMKLGQAASPFFLDIEPRPLALQLSTELLQDFHSASAPRGVEDYRKLVRQHGTVYIDLPRDSYHMFGTVHVRAIFVMDDTPAYLREHPAEGPLDHARRIKVLLWMQGAGKSGEAQEYDVTYDLDRPKETVHGMVDMHIVDTLKAMDSVLGNRPDEFRLWYDEFNDLIKLSLLFFMSESERASEERADLRDLPRITPKDLAKSRRLDKQRNKLHEASLFQVVRMHPPRDRFGRKDQEGIPKGGWELGVRTTVRGHFRWQACGARRKEHKLLYIASHERGPKEGARAQKIYRLDAKSKPPAAEDQENG